MADAAGPPFVVAGERVIRGAGCLAEGAAWLSRRDPTLGAVLPGLAPLPLRLRPGGLRGLASIVVSQQISTAAADAIWARLEAAGALAPGRLAAMGDEELRRCGLSRPKIGTLRAVAAAGIDFEALAHRPSAEVEAELTALRGIGPWTAGIYLMFCLGRADILPVGDLALQEAARMLWRLPARPGPAALAEGGRAWAPWRSVAARALWAYYRRETKREGVR